MNIRRMERNPQAPPAMEAFEQRLLLAGNVLAQVTGGGDLVITGDYEANSIIITEVDGEITITRGDADTKINGDEDIPGAGVVIDGTFSRNIKIKMGDGDDKVSIAGDYGEDEELGGVGDDADTPFAIGGNVQIDLGAGTAEAEGDPQIDQEAELNIVAVAGGVKIIAKNSNGDTATIQDGSTVGKNVQIGLDRGNNNVTITDTLIAGNLKIQNKDGAHNIAVTDITVGNLSIANGRGKNDINVANATIGKNLSIKNKQLVVAAGDPAPNQAIDVGAVTVGGSMKISNGKGATIIEVRDANVAKNLQISCKDGDDETLVSNVSAANVKINLGKGATNTGLNDVSTSGSLSITNKNGAAVTSILDTTVAKKTKLTTGNAAATLDIDVLTATGGLQIKGGDKAAGGGKLDVDIDGLTGGNVKIMGGGGGDLIELDDLTITSLQLKTGKGNDTIDIETVDTAADITSTMETLRIDAAGGVDVITIGDAGSADRGLTLTGKGVINGGKGTDTLDAAAARGNTFGVDMLTVKSIEAGDSVVV